ncbi:tRNA (N6-isopentenyl adenosine(37)-C2)-methylthiotransferase MiaB [Mariniblastus fucicola]|uniref:tRNA-2-methylthio-N(6)-dimethylallyladenosine synthase n=1 Tax=Mariniblastus fucicola TaxID=980251 RepID=A0A5B9PAV3_9BACT|nr:tRNA (N6-isopentenyl adenosine(37)-C2)-methylthiotransferase MiaB [Mariniblastus fucicola]QEG20243.1 tRNA-2-methylthio-N(6)-dimethylallyladenosine synthase [Mariniblastus fucicola]
MATDSPQTETETTVETTPVHRLYIDTVGCQMNVLDSEMVVADLRRQGYELAGSIAEADTVLFNTCSVREQAENKTYSALGRLKDEKKKHPDKIIGVMGCMAQKDQKLIFKKAPFVDIVVGPGQLKEIPGLIEKARTEGGQHTAVGLGRKDGKLDIIKRSHETFDPLRDPSMRPTPFQAYLRIQIGCDKFCTYCIVPMTRGPEQGRDPQQIYDEAVLLAEQGAKEITLLGQTVNSYKHVAEDKTVTKLADLLHKLHDIEGIERIKFVTSYPKDMTYDLLYAIRDLKKCSPYLHVPLQSGSDAVLKRMKRGYTVADYRDMMSRIHEVLGERAAISSDFIVGFCGETEEEFQETIKLVEECRFKNSFIFKYSERPGTKASDHLPDDIPFEVKKRRNNELLEVQNRISEEDNNKFMGRTVDVLVEGRSKRSDNPVNQIDGNTDAGLPGSGPVQLTGRTHCDRIVVFDGNERLAGTVVPVGIYDVSGQTLFGTIVTDHVDNASIVKLT